MKMLTVRGDITVEEISAGRGSLTLKESSVITKPRGEHSRHLWIWSRGAKYSGKHGKKRIQVVRNGIFSHVLIN